MWNCLDIREPLTAIVMLTAGIGLNLAFFQLLNGAALRPLARNSG